MRGFAPLLVLVLLSAVFSAGVVVPSDELTPAVCGKGLPPCGGGAVCYEGHCSSCLVHRNATTGEVVFEGGEGIVDTSLPCSPAWYVCEKDPVNADSRELVCVHPGLRASVRDIATLIVLFFLSMIASAGGVGGGGVCKLTFFLSFFFFFFPKAHHWHSFFFFFCVFNHSLSPSPISISSTR